MKPHSILSVLFAGLASASLADAAAITAISIVNNSSADRAITSGGRIREFRTQSFLPASTTVSGSTISFDTRFAWMLAHRVDTGGPTVALLESDLVAYDLLFTVEDPLNIGYTVSFDSVFRGYLTDVWESNSGSGASQVFSAGTLMAAQLDSGSGFGGTITDLTTTTAVGSATPTTPFRNLLVEELGVHNAGSFSGTKSFILRFTSVGNNTIGALQNFNTGEANVRFGLDPTLAGFTDASYPGADGESADTHGHLLTVTAVFNDADGGGEIPEPSTMGMALVGTALLLRRAARR